MSAINEAIDELGNEWTGDAAGAFVSAWHSPATSGPQAAMNGAADGLTSFARQLNDYADGLEHAQHEHWLQLGIMGVLTVVDVAQLGLDPLTDAAAVGIGAATAIGVPFVVAQVGVFALEGALVNFASDVIAQVGADGWDHLDGEFDGTGDHAVAFFNGQEAATSTLQGAVSFGVARSGGELLEQAGGGSMLSRAMLNPATRIASVAGLSLATDAASQLLTTGHADWEQAVISGGIGGLAGGHVWRAEDVGSVEALGRFYDPSRSDSARYNALQPDPGRGGRVKPGIGGGPDEAKAVLRLEHARLIDGPVSRSTNPEVDFVDSRGNDLDVKTEQDIHLGKGMYTLPDALEHITREVERGRTVIENIAYLSRAHARQLITAVRSDPQLAGHVIFSTSA